MGRVVAVNIVGTRTHSLAVKRLATAVSDAVVLESMTPGGADRDTVGGAVVGTRIRLGSDRDVYGVGPVAMTSSRVDPITTTSGGLGPIIMISYSLSPVAITSGMLGPVSIDTSCLASLCGTGGVVRQGLGTRTLSHTVLRHIGASS